MSDGFDSTASKSEVYPPSAEVVANVGLPHYMQIREEAARDPLAFWDARGLHLMDKWESGVAPAKSDREPGEIDWINDATKPLCLALPPRTAAELALQLAEETDRRVEALSDSLVEQMLAVGQPFNLSRANHRNEHLDEIESAL